MKKQKTFKHVLLSAVLFLSTILSCLILVSKRAYASPYTVHFYGTNANVDAEGNLTLTCNVTTQDDSYHYWYAVTTANATVHVTVDSTTFDVTGYKDAHGMPDFIYVHNGYLQINLNNFSASQCPPWAGQDYHRGWHGYENHNYHVWFEAERIAEAHYGGSATCQHSATCSACGRVYGIYIGHQSNNVWVTTPANCTTDGEQHTNCKWCGTQMNYKPLKAPGHSWGNNYESSRTNATCTTNGTIYYSHKCSRCGTVESNGTSNINALGHAWENNYESSRTNATCTTNGTIYYSHKCSRCNTVESNGTSNINALGHNWQTATTSVNNGVRTNATCTDAATYYQKCSRCTAKDTSKYNSVGERLKHIWNDGIISTAPTVYSTGIRTFTCQRDHNHVINSTEPKLQFRVFIGNKRISLNSLSSKVYSVYKGNTLLTEPSGTASKPAE